MEARIRFVFCTACLLCLLFVAGCNPTPRANNTTSIPRTDDKAESAPEPMPIGVESAACEWAGPQSATMFNAADGRISRTPDVPEQPSMIKADLIALVDGRIVVRDSIDGETITFVPDTAAGSYRSAVSDERSSFPVASAARPFPQSTFSRLSDETGELSIAGTDSDPIALRAASGGYLAGAKALRTIDSWIYLLQEELSPDDTAMQARSFVVRLDTRTGTKTQVEIPITIELESDRYADVNQQGQVLYLHATPDGGEIRVLEFDAPVAPTPTAVTPGLSGASTAPFPFDDDAFTRAVLSDAGPIPLTPGRTTRGEIIARALEFLNLEWTLSCDNYLKPGLTSQCERPTALWRRPGRLDGRFDQQVRGLPYKWGGYMGTATFLTRLDAGQLAGDDCTCRVSSANYCIVEEAAGVDCSGFVSQAWNVGYHTTSRIPQISRRIDWQQLQAGDVLNKPGSHVRLFLGFAEGDELLFDIIESAVSCGGICRRKLGATSMSGYSAQRPIHLKSES